MLLIPPTPTPGLKANPWILVSPVAFYFLKNTFRTLGVYLERLKITWKNYFVFTLHFLKPQL